MSTLHGVSFRLNRRMLRIDIRNVRMLVIPLCWIFSPCEVALRVHKSCPVVALILPSIISMIT